MNSKKIKPIENYKYLCFKCQKAFSDKNLKKVTFGDLGYGSSFDCWGSEIQLCNNCYDESNENNLWNLEIISSKYSEEYVNEDKILEFLDSLSTQIKELINNRLSFGCNSDFFMEPQDWIDYELDELSHEKCKEYGLYSYEERSAYEERFPTCKHPVNKIYKDGSKGCWCHLGANGDYGQKCGLNISDECFECDSYEIRDNLTLIEDNYKRE